VPKPKLEGGRCLIIIGTEGDAKREWQRVVAELQALKMITTLALNLLAAWCSATGDYIVAERRLRPGESVESARQ
jgi:phage terminase small subunit